MCWWLDDIQMRTFTVSPPASQVKLLRQWIISFGHHTCNYVQQTGRNQGREDLFNFNNMANLHNFELLLVSLRLTTQTRVWLGFLSTSCCKAFLFLHILLPFKMQTQPITPPLRLSAKGGEWNWLFQFCSRSQLWSGDRGLPEGSDSWTGAERQVLSGRGET